MQTPMEPAVLPLILIDGSLFFSALSTRRGPRWRKLRLGAVLVAVCVPALLATPSVAFADTGSISGRVTNGSFGGELNPLPEVFVCALQDEEEEEVQGQNCELTNSNGEYTIANLPLGDYKIEFWPRAYTQWVFEYYDDWPGPLQRCHLRPLIS